MEEIQLFKVILTNGLNGEFKLKTVRLVVEEELDKMFIGKEYDEEIIHHYRLHKVLKRKLNHIESQLDTECLSRVTYIAFTQDKTAIPLLRDKMLKMVQNRIVHHKEMLVQAERSIQDLMMTQK